MVASLRKLAIDDVDRAGFGPSVSKISGCDSGSGSTRSSSSVSSASLGAASSSSATMFKKTPSAPAPFCSARKNTTAACSSSSSSCSTSSISSSSSPYAYNSSCTVTPPLSLPSRGWGDSGGGSSGGAFRSRQQAGPAVFPTSSTSSSNYSIHDHGRHDCVAGGCVGAGGAEASADASGTGTGATALQQRRQLERFSLSDGFSSAEEETWGSEGEIEETAVAGRRHALIPGVPSGHMFHLGASAKNAVGSGSGGGSGGDNDGEEEEGDAMDEESRGLLVKGGARTSVVVAPIAPFCGGCGGGRRKAAVGAGRAKRRASLGARASGDGGCGGSSAEKTRISNAGGHTRGGSGVGGAGRWCDGGHSGGGGGSGDRGNDRPRKVSRSLFIEIENKASEPPRVPRQTAAQKKAPAPAVRGHRANNAPVGQQQRRQRRRRRSRHISGSADDADDEQGDSDDDEALCGCAHRCLRVMDSWYHAVLGGPATVKFSELDQIAEMPSSAMS